MRGNLCNPCLYNLSNGLSAFHTDQPLVEASVKIRQLVGVKAELV